MKLEVTDAVESHRWDAAITQAGGSVFHTTAWARYVTAGRANTVAEFLTLRDEGGSTQALAVGFRDRSSRRFLGSFTGQVWLDALPAGTRGASGTLSQFVRHLEQAARREGIVALSLGSFGGGGDVGSLERLGFSVSRRLEFQISLDRSEHELWQAFGSKPRNRVRRGAKHGVTIHDLPPDEGVTVLRSLQAASGARILQRGGPVILAAEAPQADPVHVLLRSGVARIVGAALGGAWVSACLFTFFNGLVYDTLAGHSQQGLEAQAPTVLLWESIRRYRSEGARVFNLGGCSISALDERSPEHGLYRYKRGLGATCVECASGVKILRTTVHRLVRLLRAVSAR